MRVLVALGGNAMTGPDGSAAPKEQRHAIARAMEHIAGLVAAGHDVVLTHGNGPHVGSLLLQQKAGEAEASPLPLDALIAMTQGWIGYLLESSFAELDPSVPIAVLLTRVMVDPESGVPDKPVGPFYSEQEAKRRAEAFGWDVAPDAGRGWRRVVLSPHPEHVFGEHHVRARLEQGSVVIACGGGGIPVARQGDRVVGVAGVIDKDRCSARLAIDIGADVLVLLTGVPRVAIDFGTRWERELSTITVEEAMRGIEDGDFPAGSMGPKIESAERFVTESGGRALITSADHLLAAVKGEDGTWLVPA
jgi:carbamate kinase